MVKTKKLLIVGLSNNSKIASYYFERDTEFSVIGFCVDKEYMKESTFCNFPIFDLEKINFSHPPEQFQIFVATGYNQMNTIRENLYLRVKKMGYLLPNYISPKCSFLSEEIIGDNNFILEDNTIQPFVKLGSNNVIWSGNHIGHDVIIGDHNFITSHVVIAGFTKIGNNTFLGINSTIRDGIIISNKTLIGAGSLILKSTEPETVYFSNKATLASFKSNEIQI
jgi:sugar O-acyltransferase (sialic acid O-acetyltransferase NeuD family)